MSTREYTLPDGSKKRHGDSGRVSGVGSFPPRWLDHQPQSILDAWGITVQIIPDPVIPKPTLDQIKKAAKADVVQLVIRASVQTQVSQAESDIDLSSDEAEVQAVLDGLRV